MTGFRKSIPPGGYPRSAWAHPQDVVKVILGELSRVTQDSHILGYLIRVGWLHDILEDGYHADGSRVVEDDLWANGVDAHIIKDVVYITRGPEETKEEYLSRLIYTPVQIKLLKCIDRVCNLRESPKKDAAWWDQYCVSTRKYILPLASSLPTTDGWNTWAMSILEHALTLRPSQRLPQVTL
jgi:hypothetical protein